MNELGALRDITLFLNVMIAGFFTYDWVMSLRRYLQFGDVRSLRNFTKSIVLVSLGYASFVRTLLLFFLPADTVGPIILMILYGVAFTGGLVIVITWQREGQA